MNTFIFIVFVLFVIGMALVKWMESQRRRKEMAATAERLGLSFNHRRDRRLDDHYGFQSLQDGDSRYGYNRMQGEYKGKWIHLFDYHYATGSGDDKTDYYQTVVILKSDIRLTRLLIRREHMMDKLGAAFGFNDIDFESAEFSQRFHVSSGNRKWAYDVIHTRVMSYLLAHEDHQIEYLDDHMLIMMPRQLLHGREIDQRIDMIMDLHEMLPAYLEGEHRLNS